MEIALISIAVCLFTAAAVYFLQERRRLALDAELQPLRSSMAVATSRIQGLEEDRQGLEQRLATLTEEWQRQSTERERLDTTLKLLERQRSEINDLLQERERALGVADADRARLGADLQVVNARLESSQAGGITLRADYEKAEKERRDLSEQVVQLGANYAALKQERDGLNTQLEAQKGWIAEQTKQFEQSVLVAATKIMEERGRVFTETNKKEVDAIVGPFKDQLAEFRRRVDEIHSHETRARGQLDEKIVQLTSLNQAVSLQAAKLTNALTIASKSTGDWGETILQKILEDSGLREGKEYRLQHSIKGVEGERLQPDAVIFLPEGRQLVVDSKVSNKAWTDYCAESDEGLKEARFKEHMVSLRAHIKGLSGKDYAHSPELQTVDFVLMFVPVEAALLTALAKDDALYGEAYRNKIILVTPSTLMAVVKLVEGIWTFQKRKESADEIADAGRRLVDKLTIFAQTFVDVGAAIQKTHDIFEKAQGQLATGPGNAIRLARRMVSLGVTSKTGKGMPPGLLQLDADKEEPTTEIAGGAWVESESPSE